MHTKENESAAESQEMNVARAKPIESIEELIRERGFFDSHNSEKKN